MWAARDHELIPESIWHADIWDATLGFPGEGPEADVVVADASSPENDPYYIEPEFGAYGVPRRARGDNNFRARRARDLPSGRPIGSRTRSSRAALVQDFERWIVRVRARPLQVVLRDAAANPTELNQMLVSYIRHMWRSGAPMYKTSETLNAIAAMSGGLRRVMFPAWDLVRQWLDQEPGSHHTAMPRSVLCAFISVALLRGWVKVAVLLASGRCGIMRPSEFLLAQRRHLVLPRDVNGDQDYALFIIDKPKMGRLPTTASRQSRRVEPRDLVAALDTIFGDLAPSSRLWPAAQDTFRRRFREIGRFLEVPVDAADRPAFGSEDDAQVLDLGSLRAGGATDLFRLTENESLVAGRGGWNDRKVMKIYLQELVSTTFLSNLEESTRRRLAVFANQCPYIWHHSFRWLRQGSDAASLPHMWASFLSR